MNKKESKKKNIEKNEKNKKRKKNHKVLRTFMTFFLIIVLLIAGFVGYSAYKNGWGVKGLIQTAIGKDERKLANLEPFTVLLLGVSEDIQTKLTDTIIVASYNPKTQKATLISIPRDTFVGSNKKKATSGDKINALYQSSPEKTLAAVNKLTGLNITYYIVVSNNALVELVDEIDGVEFDVPINMDYEDSSQDLYIHLKAGPQRLTGEQAEWLVRFRKNTNGTSYPAEYGDNDLGRMRTQREFLKAVAEQMIQLKNITKIGNFIDIFKENVTTNIKNWSQIKDYVAYGIDFNTENLQTATIPGTTDNFGPYRLSYFVHDEKQTKALIEEIFIEQNGKQEENTEKENDTTTNSTSNTSSGENTNSSKNANTNKNTNSSNTTSNNTTSEKNSDIKIELLNGSGDSTLLTKATKELKNQGYNVYKTGTTTTTSKTTIINKKAVSSSITESIKKLLGAGNISNSTSSVSTVDITIILGKDYK